MRIETYSNIGQQVYLKDRKSGQIRILTVGQIKIEITDSPGIPGETTFDNYKPQKSYEEKVMCLETGIGSGHVFTIKSTNQEPHVFVSREKAEASEGL